MIDIITVNQDYMVDGLDKSDIESILDDDEISRIELWDDNIFIIWKAPKPLDNDNFKLKVYSVGLYFNTTSKDLKLMAGETEYISTPKEDDPINFILKYLFMSTKHFVGHLKTIKTVMMELESRIHTSLENKYLLNMFTLGESMIYYLAAIEANKAVLYKLKKKVNKLCMDDDQIDLLEDVIHENEQCLRLVRIYSETLSGLMDARGTIVNNNMNMLLKNLTLINVIFLPLNLLASIGGMSEYSAMTNFLPIGVSYGLFMVSMLLLGYFTNKLIVKFLDKEYTRR